MVSTGQFVAVDEVLRRYRENSNPVGGVQLLMIADLNQRPLKVKLDQWPTLSQYYQTLFLSSLALLQSDY